MDIATPAPATHGLRSLHQNQTPTGATSHTKDFQGTKTLQRPRTGLRDITNQTPVHPLLKKTQAGAGVAGGSVVKPASTLLKQQGLLTGRSQYAPSRLHLMKTPGPVRESGMRTSIAAAPATTSATVPAEDNELEYMPPKCEPIDDHEFIDMELIPVQQVKKIVQNCSITGSLAIPPPSDFDAWSPDSNDGLDMPDGGISQADIDFGLDDVDTQEPFALPELPDILDLDMFN